LARDFSIPLDLQDKNALYGVGNIGQSCVLLVKPQAFMNRSGPAVYRLAEQYEIKSEKIVVIHDDLDLAFGRLKIKEKGGSGGHKGIGSLVDAFGGGDFTRIRIGIGRPEQGNDVVTYVLGEFSGDEKLILKTVIARVAEATKTILCQGIREAMNSFNDRRLNTSS